jgi:hypothetical protein
MREEGIWKSALDNMYYFWLIGIRVVEFGRRPHLAMFMQKQDSFFGNWGCLVWALIWWSRRRHHVKEVSSQLRCFKYLSRVMSV